MPNEDLIYLLIFLTGITILVWELPWWILVIWVAISMFCMVRIETNSRKVRRED